MFIDWWYSIQMLYDFLLHVLFLSIAIACISLLVFMHNMRSSGWFHAISMLFTTTHSSMSAWPIGPPSRMCLAPSCVYSMAVPTRTASPPLDPLRTITEPLTDSTRFLFTLPSFIIILLSDQRRQQSQDKQRSTLKYCMFFNALYFALHFDTSSFRL